MTFSPDLIAAILAGVGTALTGCCTGLVALLGAIGGFFALTRTSRAEAAEKRAQARRVELQADSEATAAKIAARRDELAMWQDMAHRLETLNNSITTRNQGLEAENDKLHSDLNDCRDHLSELEREDAKLKGAIRDQEAQVIEAHELIQYLTGLVRTMRAVLEAHKLDVPVRREYDREMLVRVGLESDTDTKPDLITPVAGKE